MGVVFYTWNSIQTPPIRFELLWQSIKWRFVDVVNRWTNWLIDETYLKAVTQPTVELLSLCETHKKRLLFQWFCTRARLKCNKKYNNFESVFLFAISTAPKRPPLVDFCCLTTYDLFAVCVNTHRADLLAEESKKSFLTDTHNLWYAHFSFSTFDLLLALFMVNSNEIRYTLENVFNCTFSSVSFQIEVRFRITDLSLLSTYMLFHTVFFSFVNGLIECFPPLGIWTVILPNGILMNKQQYFFPYN